MLAIYKVLLIANTTLAVVPSFQDGFLKQQVKDKVFLIIKYNLHVNSLAMPIKLT